MAHAAVAKLFQPARGSMIIAHQFPGAEGLVLWRFPVHLEDFSAWSDEFLRRFVAIQAPTHVQRLRLPGDGHLIHFPMTGGTTDSFLDVNAVIKEYKVRQLVDSRPVNGLLADEALPNG